MKLPKDIPFVILDRNMYGTRETSRLTEDFIEWLVRDCARVCDAKADSVYPHAKGPYLDMRDAILARYEIEKHPKVAPGPKPPPRAIGWPEEVG